MVSPRNVSAPSGHASCESATVSSHSPEATTVKDRDLYTIQEARERLGGVSRNSIYGLLRTGQLASVVIGCRRFIAATAIVDLIAKSTTTESPSKDAARSRPPLQSEPVSCHPTQARIRR